MVVIYLDVLIVLNIYVNFFLLKATARFTHTLLKTVRCIISSVLGSLFSLAILLPVNNFFLTLMIKLIAAVMITAIAFGIKNKKAFARLIIYFYIINFIFAGIVGFLYTTLNPSFMAFNNAYFYVDFSLISLIVFTAVAYFIITVLRKIMDKGGESSKKYNVCIKYNDRLVQLTAIADTGNALTDSFTGKPVIICPADKLGFDLKILSLSPQELFEKYGFRMLPYSTIGNSGLIPIFLPNEIIITEEELHNYFKVDAFIGIIDKETPVIFNPKLLI